MQTFTKEFLFKGANSGISRKSNKPYSTIELHESATLENTTFFLNDGQVIPTDDLKLKDKVVAELEMTIQNGRPAFVLKSLKKAAA